MADKILIVDDEPAVRHFLAKVLKHDGYELVTVESGEAALERCAVDEFDLALVDLKLKGMGGLDVLAALRRQWPATILIVLTAHASLETAVEALRLGAHDYLFKPCKTVDLRQSVRAGLLKRRELVGPPASHDDVHAGPLPARAEGRFLQLAGLIVDPIRHIITLDGCLLELSPTEFDLLAYLVSEAPRVIPPRELVREVHGYESDSPEARETVRSHIYHIRQKMKSAAGRDMIRTVRGVGYAVST